MSAVADEGILTSSSGRPIAALGIMALLAALDVAGTLLAKEWTVHRQPWQLAGGMAAFAALFAVLAVGLRFAEMTIVTLGWIVLLQTAVILVDRSRYGLHLSTGGWVAIATIFVLQGYLMLSGSAMSSPDGASVDARPAAVVDR